MASSWDRRNEAARAKGYRNYYDYRIHDYGKRPASEPVQPAVRQRLAGGRGAAGLRRALRDPDRIALIVEVPLRSNASGQWTHVGYIATFTDGRIVEYRVPIESESDLDLWHEHFTDAGVDFLEYADGGAAGTVAETG